MDGTNEIVERVGWLTPNGCRLTRRERDVVQLLKDGRSNKEIAQALNTTERTVKFHVSNLLEKHGARSRLDIAVMYARLEGERK